VSTPVPGGDLDPDAVTHLLYTSGTTGRPKGVLCTNRTLVTQAQNLAHTSKMAERGGHHLNIVPLFHAGGLNVFTNPMLYWGGRVTTVRRFDPQVTLDLLADPELRITHLCGVLQMYEWLVRLDGFPAAEFPTLETVLFGGWGTIHRGDPPRVPGARDPCAAVLRCERARTQCHDPLPPRRRGRRGGIVGHRAAVHPDPADRPGRH
jgi:acyl-CoA synthetase (AMP-forming)/AMP-acid ligase II